MTRGTYTDTSVDGGSVVFPTATHVADRTRVQGDSFDRWIRHANGTAYLGDGTAAPALTVFGGAFDRITADVTLADTTLAASGLSVPVEANGVYWVHAQLAFTSPQADDVQCRVNGPSGATAPNLHIGGLVATATATTGDADFAAVAINTAATRGSVDATKIVVPITGLIIVSTTAGNIDITVAKGTDTGADGALEDGSYLLALRVA